MAAPRRKKAKAKRSSAAAKAGLFTTLGDRIKKIATGIVKRKKKRASTKKAAAARKKRTPRAKKARAPATPAS